MKDQSKANTISSNHPQFNIQTNNEYEGKESEWIEYERIVYEGLKYESKLNVVKGKMWKR